MRRGPTRRSARPGVLMPQRVYWRNVVRIGVGRATSRFEDGNDSDHRGTSTVEARSAGSLGPPGGRNRVASRALTTTPRAAPESRSSSSKLHKQNGRHSTGVKLGSYDGNTCLQTFLASSKTTRSTSNGTRPTSCFNCVPVWLEQPVRFCGTLENSRRWAESSLCSKLVSAAKTKPNVSVPKATCRKRPKGESLQKCYQDVRRLTISRRVICSSRHRRTRRLSGGIGRSDAASAHSGEGAKKFERRSQHGQPFGGVRHHGLRRKEGEKQIEIRLCRSRRQRIHRFGGSEGFGKDCKTAC